MQYVRKMRSHVPRRAAARTCRCRAAAPLVLESREPERGFLRLVARSPKAAKAASRRRQAAQPQVASLCPPKAASLPQASQHTRQLLRRRCCPKAAQPHDGSERGHAAASGAFVSGATLLPSEQLSSTLQARRGCCRRCRRPASTERSWSSSLLPRTSPEMGLSTGTSRRFSFLKR